MDILDEAVKKFIQKEIMIDGDESVANAAKMMKDKKVGSLIVKDKNTNGIITERDILYKITAEGKDAKKVKVKDIMSKPLITIDANASVKDAIALMSKHNIRRVVVVENNQIIGVVTQRVITGNIKDYETPIASIDIPKGILCPYCESSFDTKEELSKHIDKIHIGLGLLEGDVRKL